jgi:hypothetical protein
MNVVVYMGGSHVGGQPILCEISQRELSRGRELAGIRRVAGGWLWWGWEVGLPRCIDRRN